MEVVFKNKNYTKMPESWHLWDDEQLIFHLCIHQQWGGQCSPSEAGDGPWPHSLD